MKRLFLPIILACIASISTWAANKSTTVEQVAEAVTLADDVDFHITSATPFATGGSIDITNLDHAVIIFDNLKPSLALKQLSHITINGAKATSEKNCQVRIYDRGAILFPYGKEGTAATSFHPLVVFDEKNLQGNSCELFGLENTGGYMNTLTAAKMNNKIRSFTLKRGYMVTFSLRSGGYGYSRCFIADKADLIINSLPTLMDQRISSYRVFRWQNTSKVGVADLLDENVLAKLNAQTSFTWGPGRSMLPDVEVVPHRIDESWPSPKECGQATYSCHLKTNNEPRNQSDHGTWTMEQILGNWQDLMRTGMRLCTPSSWDGSDYWNATGFLADFLNEIDKRGWRCDIIDLHGYWNESAFTTNVNNWAQTFKRPVWITEWVWGASWSGGSGIFKEASSLDNPTAADLQLNKTVVSRILDNLNNNNACERYFYWNGERNCSKIYRDGKLTPTGEYFATMKTKGPGYTGFGNYVPKTPPFYTVSDLAATYTARTGACKFTWTNQNYDLTDLTVLQHRTAGGTWKSIDTLAYSEQLARTATATLDRNASPGLNEFRLLCNDADGKTRYSNITSIFIGVATTYGDIMAGHIEANNSEPSSIFFAAQEDFPVVITGIATNKNTANGIFNHVSSIAKDNFTFNFEPWTLGTALNFKNTETTDYFVIQPGAYEWEGLRVIVDTCAYTNKSGIRATMSQGDTIEVLFREPFAEGVTPVVIPQNVSAETAHPAAPRLLEVTNKGFKMKIIQQSTMKTKPRQQYTFYIAMAPGSAKLGTTGMRIHAGHSKEPIGGASFISCTFTDQAGDTIYLREPYVLAATQTHNLDFTSVFRKNSDLTRTVQDEQGEDVTETYGFRVRRQMDGTATIPSGQNTADKTGDFLGWIAIDHDPTATRIVAPFLPQQQFLVEVRQGRVFPSDPTARIYTASGTQVQAGTILPRGIYIVTNGRATTKVFVR